MANFSIIECKYESHVISTKLLSFTAFILDYEQVFPTEHSQIPTEAN